MYDRPNYMNTPEAGLASLLSSRGRDGDSVLVHMAPQEVAGLQQLAMAHGGSLTINPQTGLYEASFLKKILPQIIGAVLPSVPGLGSITKTLGFGNEALGSALIVGGATGLIEGDLKKGLMAGLGAYSGASIAGGLKAAAGVGAPAEAVAEVPTSQVTTGATKPSFAPPSIKDKILSGGIAPRGFDIDATRAANWAASNTPTGAAPIQAATTVKPPTTFLSQMGQGVKNVLTTKEGAEKFMEGLGGGYTSPIGSALSRYAAFSGAMLPFAQEQKQFPVGSAGGDEIVYIPGQYDPSNTSVFQAQGQYYRRTPKGLVPYNPWAMAPGARGFADGGAVSEDPTVLATRSYIQELNRRALNPFTGEPTSGIGGGGGLNAFGPQYLPPATTGSGVDAGGGDVGGASAGDIVGGLATSYLINKGLEKGAEYLGDKFAEATGPQYGVSTDAYDKIEQEVINRAKQTPIEDSLSGVDINALPTTAAALSALNPFAGPAPQFNVGVEEIADVGPGTQAEQKLDADLEAKTKVGGDLGASPSTYLAGASGLAGLAGLANAGKAASIAIELPVYDKLGNLVGFSSSAPGAAGAATSAASGAGGAGTAGAAGTEAAGAGAGGIGSKIIPGVATALGAYSTAKAIEAGKEGQAAFSAASTAASAAKLGAPLGPAGILAAAAIAAIGASMVNTKEQGDIALRNYWKAVDQGRGLGSAPPEELANGFINFYRTNKNNFAGQEKYGRKGNEDFVYDMTQVVNKAVKDGTVSKDADAHEIYQKAVQPWLNSMGSGPQDADAKRIQDYMMTDMIYNFMQGKPISNAQVKGDKKFKIVSEKPVFAGNVQAQTEQPRPQPTGNAVIDQAADKFLRSQQQQGGLPQVSNPFAGEDIRKLLEERGAVDTYRQLFGQESGAVDTYRQLFGQEPEPTIPTAVNPFAEAPVQVKRGIPVDELIDMGAPLEERESRFAFGGAVGDDFNFGFAGGGMPEYKAGGKLLNGPGDGMSDDIPAVIRGKGVQRAALADGEFVVPADVVSHLGNGSTKAGAKKLYDMMARIRKARTGETRQAPAVKANRYLPA